MTRGRRARAVAGPSLAGLLLLAACSGDDSVAPSDPSVTDAATSTLPDVSDDGILRLGLLVPLSGPGRSIGEPIERAVQSAVETANAQGGVLGHRVEVVVEDEGNDATTATRAIAAMSDDGVDAIVGPTSSRIALAVLDQIISADLVACSPTATSIALADYPDHGRFFRTITPDSVEAHEAAKLAGEQGADDVGIITPDDAFGRLYADALLDALAREGLRVVSQTAYDPVEPDLDGIVADLGASDAEVAVVVGNAETGPVVAVDVLRNTGLNVVVNGAMRRPEDPAILANLSPVTRQRLRGVSPSPYPVNETASAGANLRDPSRAFATQAVDCVAILTLASAAAGSDGADAIAREVPSVSGGGQACDDIPTCLVAIAAGRNVDYRGLDGFFQLDANGDATNGRYEVFGYDSSGIDVLRAVRVAAGD